MIYRGVLSELYMSINLINQQVLFYKLNITTFSISEKYLRVSAYLVTALFGHFERAVLYIFTCFPRVYFFTILFATVYTAFITNRE